MTVETATAAQKPSLAYSVLAALVPFSGPLWLLAAFAAISARALPDPDDSYVPGPFQGMADAWNAGGYGMYLVLAAGGLCALLGAVLLAVGARRETSASLACLPVALGPAAAGLLGMSNGLVGAMAAVVHAAPGDAAIIMTAEIGELMQVALFGFAATGTLLAVFAAGLALGALAHRRGPARHHLTLAAAAGAAALAAGAAFASAAHQSALSAAYMALAHASRGVELEALAIPPGASGRWWWAAAAVAIGLGAASARQVPSRSAALVLAGGLLVGGALGLSRLTTAVRVDAGTFLGTLRPALIELDGEGARASVSLLVRGTQVQQFVAREGLDDDGPAWPLVPGVAVARTDSDLAAMLRSSADRVLLHGELPGVGLVADSDSAAVHHVLEVAQKQGLGRVALRGQHHRARQPGGAPGELGPVLDALDVTETQAPLELTAAATACKPECDFATLTEHGLLVGGETWGPSNAPPPPSAKEVEPQGRVFLQASPAIPPLSLARAALAARSHDAQLVLVF